MFSKIWACLLSFLLCVFPFLRPQVQALDAETVANSVMCAIETRNIPLFEDQLCRNIRNNTENLSERITELFNAINGEILEFSWTTVGAYSGNHSNGKSIRQIGVNIRFKTETVENYVLVLTLETYNSFQPTEMGIRAASLAISGSGIALADIRATNGIGEWHE